MPLPRISIRALQAFIAVYEEQSFSRAAERENATQSGMSTQVKNLERRLGSDLLIRERNNFELTTAGKIVYQEGLEILKLLSKTEQRVQNLDDAHHGVLAFGMIPTLTRTVFTQVVEPFKKTLPNVELSMIEEYSGSLLNRVNSGEIEFAVVPAGDLPTGLSAQFIGRDREMVMARKGSFPDHPHLTPLPLGALNGAKLIVPSSVNIRRRRINDALQAHNVRLESLLEMDGMLATIELVAASDWVTILPSAICFADKEGCSRSLHPLSDPPMTTEYILVQKSERFLTHSARILSEEIVRAVQDIVTAWEDV